MPPKLELFILCRCSKARQMKQNDTALWASLCGKIYNSNSVAAVRKQKNQKTHNTFHVREQVKNKSFRLICKHSINSLIFLFEQTAAARRKKINRTNTKPPVLFRNNQCQLFILLNKIYRNLEISCALTEIIRKSFPCACKLRARAPSIIWPLICNKKPRKKFETLIFVNSIGEAMLWQHHVIFRTRKGRFRCR